ncbi:transporter [Sphingomonas tabacisoli]|uniref:Transporter n=1 Tax=Sphingomonas tabacisoli TaxID=2249466 RepID=A0ABW4I2Q0_9SPHN
MRAEERDFCPERPGLDTPPCIVDAGHASLEVSAVDWTLDRQPRSRTDTILSGDTLLRLGLTSRLEAQIGWTAYGHVRTRTPLGVSTQSGTGDVLLGTKFSLLHPDGQGTSVALKPFVTLPTGGSAIGAGTWSVGIQVPISVTVAKGVQLTATPEADAAANQSGDGRHFAWGSAAGAQFALTGSTSLALEGQVTRDDDPSGHTTSALGEASLAWQAGKNSQLDIGVVAGLNHNSPDVELIAGIARRF